MEWGGWLPMGYHYYWKDPIPWPLENAVDFSGLPPASETPTVITSISPTTVVEGSGPLTISIQGRNFISTAVVQVADQMLKTEKVSDTELRATVPAELVKQVGTYPVQVAHRAPGWGKTNTMYLIVKFK